ncbi:MAG TPA: alpha/beta fold hydrolase [Acidimicrobiales bacterium]|nr:alpha/beta fold hydrolase [Acidimicrobiales bacterium]
MLLHGLGATAALNWDASIPTLARHFRVLAPDLRGHGRGIRCGARFRLDDCADDVAALLRQEHLGPALIAGYSMGGPVAQLLALRHPRLVAGLVLCATARDFRGRPGERATFGALGLTTFASRFTPAIPAARLRAPWVPRLAGTLVAELGGHEQRALLAAAASLGTFTSRDWVADLTAPAVVVATTRDRVVPPRRQQKLAASLGAPVIELAAGHFVPRTDPHALATAIVSAARALPRRRSQRPGQRQRRTAA